jgi:hypothetical protein
MPDLHDPRAADRPPLAPVQRRPVADAVLMTNVTIDIHDDRH